MKPFLILVLSFLCSFCFSQKYFMGLPEGPDTLYEKLDVKVTMTSATYRNVGSSFSLKQYAPTPKSQGSYGTCAAWATAYCARTILESIANNETDKETITNNSFSPGFVYRLAAPKSLDCRGSLNTECLRQITLNGVPKLSDYSDPCPSSIPIGIFKMAQNNTIKTFVKLWDDDGNFLPLVSAKIKVQMVKKSLSESCPVVLAIYCPNSFHDYKGGDWRPTEEVGEKVNHEHGRHASCAIGYDDEKYGGALEIQNSWGEDWGDGGYAWIKYEDFAKFAFQAIEVVGNPVNPLQNDRTVVGGIKLIRSDGSSATAFQNADGSFKLKEDLRSGERFRLFLNSSQPSFVYLFNLDTKSKWNLLFPFNGISAYLNYDDSEIPIPSEDKFMRLNGDKGEERLIVLYSPNPLNTDEFLQKIASQPATLSLSQKLKNVIGPNFISLQGDKNVAGVKNIDYQVSLKSQQTLGIIISFNHTD